MGRQFIDLKTIITNIYGARTEATTTGAVGPGAAAATNANPKPMVTLDLVPTVQTDGITLQLALASETAEFLGYDPPGQVLQQPLGTTSLTGSAAATQLPLPHYRLHQSATSVILWDGQTAVLGGKMAGVFSKEKDQVPFPGDSPLLDRPRGESSTTKKKNLMIFVTPTIVDASGKRLHEDGELPFTADSVPRQAGSAAPTTTPDH